MNSKHMSLNNIFVPLRVTSVVASMLQLYPCQVQNAVIEHTHFFFVQSCQILAIPFPHDWRYRTPGDVTLNLNVIAYPCRQTVDLQGLVQGNDRYTCRGKRKGCVGDSNNICQRGYWDSLDLKWLCTRYNLKCFF